MICTSISDSSQLDTVLKGGAELIELRLDLIGQQPSELYSKIPSGVKSIATCREGVYGEKERLELLKDSIELGASYVDIELETTDVFARELMASAEKTGCELIFSHHDFEGTPSLEELRSKLEACYSRGGALAKIATLVQSKEDVLKLFSLYSHPGRKVVLGMGPQGRITRLAAPILGSEFTFASPFEGGETAPGQMSAEQLKAIYKILLGS